MNNEDFQENVHEYKITQKNRVIEGEKEVTVYGVTVAKRGCVKSDDARCRVRIEDISSDRKTVEEFVNALSRNNISPIHIHDCLEDFFSL